MNSKPAYRIKPRLFFAGLFFFLLLLALLWRMLDLTVLSRDFLLNQGAARSLRYIDLPAYRGMITDRNGVPLAISTPVQSLWLNPKEFSSDKEQFYTLAKILKISPQKLAFKIEKAKNREFLYLARHLLPEQSTAIEALKISGVHFQQEFQRYYPESDAMAQIIGFTNIDDQGIEGMERYYQSWLAGESGKRKVIKDRIGRVIEDLGVVKEPKSGHDLTLTIDRRIQYLAYEALGKTVEEFGAKAGTVVVLDSQNGEILAMANVPSYNPNARGHYDLETYRNRAITDLFEPGSVVKAFSIASALESGQFKPDTIIDTNPGWMSVQGKLVRDVHNYGVLDVTGVLQHSSNIGVTKMILSNPPELLINLYKRCGIGQKPESGAPGESEGSIVSVREARPFVLATLGFGYGLNVNALQLARAYSVFANHGRLKSVSILKGQEVTEQQVISQHTADQILLMLEAVMGKEGTGRFASIPGYRVAGKTGTARVAGKHGYDPHRHIASFVGIAPVTNPKLIVVVVIHEPSKKSYYGASVAAPLFGKITGGALRMLEVLPDNAA